MSFTKTIIHSKRNRIHFFQYHCREIYLLTQQVRQGCLFTSDVGVTGVYEQGMSNVFAAPPMKYFKIFCRLSIPKHNPNPNLKP